MQKDTPGPKQGNMGMRAKYIFKNTMTGHLPRFDESYSMQEINNTTDRPVGCGSRFWKEVHDGEQCKYRILSD